MFKVRIIGPNHCLGMEEFYYKLPGRIFSAKTYSEVIKVYKIDTNVKRPYLLETQCHYF